MKKTKRPKEPGDLRCSACGQLTSGGLVVVKPVPLEGGLPFVGRDCCYPLIEAAGEAGYQPPKGPRLAALTEQENKNLEARWLELAGALGEAAARHEWSRVERARTMPRPDKQVHLYDEERGTACGLAVSSMWPELREALLIERDERIGLTKDPKEVTCSDCRAGRKPLIALRERHRTDPSGDLPRKNSMSETEERQAFVDRTRAARVARFKTQTPMLTILGLDQATYKQYETRTPLPHRFIPKFCAATGVGIEWLLTGRGKGPAVR